MTAAEPEPRPTLCHGLVQAIATSLRSHAAARGVELVVAPVAEELVVRTDRKTLGTILLSLISSAIDGTTHGRVEVRVSRSARAGSRSVEIHVTSIGLPGEASAADAAGEHALPLSAMRDLAARLGGQISLHVTAAAGSSYELRLPEG